MIVLKLLFYLIVLIGILFLAYYTTKLLGRGMGGRQNTGGMHVLDKMTVGRDTYLLVVEVQGQIMLLGVSPAGITKLQDLAEYRKKDEPVPVMDFKTALAKQLQAGIGSFNGHKKKEGK